MTLRTKLNLHAAVAVSTLLLIVALTSVTHLRRSRLDAREETADRVVVCLSELDSLTYDFLYRGHERAESQWLLRHAEPGQRIAQLRVHARGEEAAVAQLKADLAATTRLFESLRASLGEAASGRTPLSLPGAREQHLATQLSLRMHAMLAAASRLSTEGHRQSARLHQQERRMVLAGRALLGLLVILVPILVSRTLVRPISRLCRDIAIIGQGRLDHRVGTGTKDEIGELSAAIDAMSANLRQVLASRDELNREVTERRRIEEELRVSEQFLAECSMRSRMVSPSWPGI